MMTARNVCVTMLILVLKKLLMINWIEDTQSWVVTHNVDDVSGTEYNNVARGDQQQDLCNYAINLVFVF